MIRYMSCSIGGLYNQLNSPEDRGSYAKCTSTDNQVKELPRFSSLLAQNVQVCNTTDAPSSCSFKSKSTSYGQARCCRGDSASRLIVETDDEIIIDRD